MRRRRALACIATAWLVVAAAPAAGQLPTGFVDVVVARDLDFPSALAFTPDGRVLVGEQYSTRIVCIAAGRVRVVADSIPGTRRTEAEGGLLGLAVDPSWPRRPYLYTFTTRFPAPMSIARWEIAGADGDSPRLAPGSRRELLAVLRDSLPHHNGGTLRFGPDGMLYASVGDDGDPCSALVWRTLRGAILRLDVAGVPPGPGGAPPLTTLRPRDTPATADSLADVAWAHGFRNPFRFSIDPLTGVLYVADVGEHDVEEVDRVAARGYNGGWPLREGPRATGSRCALFDYIVSPPVYWYDRVGVTAAIVAAGVSRPAVRPAFGAFPPAYDGVAFVTDYYQGFVRALRLQDGVYAPWHVPGMADSASGDWARGFESVADAQFGPDGALWYVRQALPRFTAGTGQLGRIGWTGTPAPGSASFTLRVRAPAFPGDGARVSFTTPAAAAVRVEAFDAAGRLLAVLAHDGVFPAGDHLLRWGHATAAGARLSRGVVFVRLDVDGVTSTARAFLP